MGANTNSFRKLIDSAMAKKTVIDVSYEHIPGFDNYFYHTDGSLFPVYGNAVEIKLRLPPGNYEVEAIVRLYNNNEEKVHYGCNLYFFLDEDQRDVWEGGEIGQSIHTSPHVTHFKVMTCFDKSKDIRFSMGTSADNAFMAENACLLVRRIGSLSYKAKN